MRRNGGSRLRKEPSVLVVGDKGSSARLANVDCERSRACALRVTSQSRKEAHAETIHVYSRLTGIELPWSF